MRDWKGTCTMRIALPQGALWPRESDFCAQRVFDHESKTRFCGMIKRIRFETDRRGHVGRFERWSRCVERMSVCSGFGLLKMNPRFWRTGRMSKKSLAEDELAAPASVSLELPWPPQSKLRGEAALLPLHLHSV
jgi:hypothetical protein